MQEQRRRRYVAHLERHPDGLRRNCVPDHLTASTVVLSSDHERVLLTLHAKAGAWFQFGGHCEPGDATLAGAAAREAVEESGIEALTVDPVPVQLHEHVVPFCRPGGGRDSGRRVVHHLDVRFVAVAAPGATPAVSPESLDVRWWPWHSLPTPDDDMRELVAAARARVAAPASR